MTESIWIEPRIAVIWWNPISWLLRLVDRRWDLVSDHGSEYYCYIIATRRNRRGVLRLKKEIGDD
uniref:Uncharacterized protein n=1 Tax=viral metagenome TaxID=1070528 RepID=A0A6H1Z7X6_9ZZZZ